MRFRFQFRKYRLPFRTAVRTAHGRWAEREGVIVRLEDASEGNSGAVGWGEAAPIPWFGTETVDEVEEGCRAIGEWIEETAFEGVPNRLTCLRHALAVAQAEVNAGAAAVNRREGVSEPSTLRAASPALAVAALLPAGRAALPLIPPQGEMGFRVFKWKVGVGDLADELGLLDDVCAALPAGGKLRLDANGAWDRKQAERWLERCADRPVEFVEQPCFTAASEGEVAQRRNEELLLGLAGDYPTPLALDESLVGDRDVERWIGAGWPGIFVVKPLLLADPAGALARLQKANAQVVFSSALETGVGARVALRFAFGWSASPAAPGAPPPRALGFGVWPLFADAGFDGPFRAPFWRLEDVEFLKPQALWNALS